MKSVLKKLNIFNYIEILLIIITLVLYIFPLKNDKIINYPNKNNTVGYMNQDSIIESKFNINIDELEQIGIVFSTYGKENTHGKILIQIMNEKNKKIHDEYVNASEIVDNQLYTINLKRQRDVHGKTYKMIIDCEEFYDDISLTTWLEPTGDSELYAKVNGQIVGQTLSLSYGGKVKQRFYAWYPLLALFVVFTISNVASS